MPNHGSQTSLSICNVMESALPRASELVVYTEAGAEIEVASSKALYYPVSGFIWFGGDTRSCAWLCG